MPNRSYSSNAYRYGFNGKEDDNEVKGITGSQQDYGKRIYDPRLGRFLSVDPISPKFPALTPYQFASNSPISLIDLDGLEGNKRPVAPMWACPVLTNREALFEKGLKYGKEQGLLSLFSFDYWANLIAAMGQENSISLPDFDAMGDYIQADPYGAGASIGKTYSQNVGLFAFGIGVETVAGEFSFMKTNPIIEEESLIATRAPTEITQARRELATSWMQTSDKTAYVNFGKAVYTDDIQGMELIQYRVKGQLGTFGDFYALPGTTPEQIGLNSADVVKTYDVKINSGKEVKALFSTHIEDATYYANPSIKVEGGGTQIYGKDIKNNATFTEKVD